MFVFLLAVCSFAFAVSFIFAAYNTPKSIKKIKNKTKTKKRENQKTKHIAYPKLGRCKELGPGMFFWCVLSFKFLVVLVRCFFVKGWQDKKWRPQPFCIPFATSLSLVFANSFWLFLLCCESEVSLKKTTTKPRKNIDIIGGNLWVGTWIRQHVFLFFHKMQKMQQIQPMNLRINMDFGIVQSSSWANTCSISLISLIHYMGKS